LLKLWFFFAVLVNIIVRGHMKKQYFANNVQQSIPDINRFMESFKKDPDAAMHEIERDMAELRFGILKNMNEKSLQFKD
jgi:hypothetical protein